MSEHQPEILQQIVHQLSRMENNIDNLCNDIASLKEDMVNVKNDITSLKEDMVNVKNDITSLHKDQVELYHIVLRMEQEHGAKLSALYDGFLMRGDQIELLRRYLDERFNNFEAGIAAAVNDTINAALNRARQEFQGSFNELAGKIDYLLFKIAEHDARLFTLKR